ncbi:MAG TPA: S8 family serine peptidase [Candidatus Acidoferrales bacterium]|nr:S8 family serine peptidase [Candidatus Acidoferrales bacterium]
MKRSAWLCVGILLVLWSTPAAAQNQFIVRSTLGTAGLTSVVDTLCGAVLGCSVTSGLDATLGQLFLVTTPSLIDAQTFLTALQNTPGIVDAELNQILSLVGGTNTVGTPPASLTDSAPVSYYGATAWNGYVNQPAASVVRVSEAHTTFNVAGTGIVADIDTGVDPNNPVLKPVLLPGYDFTRNQPGGSEMTDVASLGLNPTPTTTNVATVNQQSAAVLDQQSAAVLDQTQFEAFGHGTMVLGIIHLVAPNAQLLPLKAFKADGTGQLSDIIRAIYYAVANKANVINMSFDTKTNSLELSKALAYASTNSLISAASAGNDGAQEIVYPAAIVNDVMGVASVGSTSTTDSTRSSFSNFGNSIVWVAAPGEGIVTTYPFSTYAAGWGTSFSAPFVSGAGALLLNQQPSTNEAAAAAAVAHAQPLTDPGMGNGRLDLVQALQSQQSGTSGDFSVSASPSSGTASAGQSASFTITASPSGGFNQTVTWSCSGAPAGSTCTVSPVAVKLDGTNQASATVTITTTGSALFAPLNHPRFVTPLMLWALGILLAILWFAWLLMFGVYANRGSSWHKNFSYCAVGLLLISAFCAACGSGAGTLLSPSALTSASVNPGSVTGGSSSATGSVMLSGPAPSGGADVALTSSNTAAASVPASVKVAAGATSATFPIITSAVSSATNVTISASYAGATQTASFTVTPASTPAGTYTFTVTGSSGNVSHAATFTLTVN